VPCARAACAHRAELNINTHDNHAKVSGHANPRTWGRRLQRLYTVTMCERAPRHVAHMLVAHRTPQRGDMRRAARQCPRPPNRWRGAVASCCLPGPRETAGSLTTHSRRILAQSSADSCLASFMSHAVERRVPASSFRAGGHRVCTTSRASAVLVAHTLLARTHPAGYVTRRPPHRLPCTHHSYDPPPSQLIGARPGMAHACLSLPTSSHPCRPLAARGLMVAAAWRRVAAHAP